LNPTSAPKDSKWIQAAWQSGAILLAAVVLGLIVNTVRPGGLPLIGKWAPAEQVKAGGLPESTVISLDEAQVLFFGEQAVFIDARPEPLYREGHIEGALSLPWDDYDQRADAVLQHLPRETVLITYCDGEGCSLSKELAIALLVGGYKNVRILVNGWSLWLQANLPTAGMGG
jgi:rhodanese-related sulfurtransferase